MARGQLAQLDELAALVISFGDDELAEFLEGLAPDELELIDLALSKRVQESWRSSPATMAAHLDGNNYTLFRYVELLGDTMAKVIETAAGARTTDPWDRVLIMMPARYGKTTTTSQWAPAWGLDRYPWLHFILASYGHELATTNSLAVRDIIEMHAEVLNVKIRRDKRAASRWRTTDGGQVRAVGVGSGLTGHGGDVIVVDDPFKDWQAAHSPTIRDTVWNWYKSVVRTRLQTDNSAIVVVGTRWHEDDLVGRLLAPPDDSEKESWRVVRMPALAEAPDPNGKPWEQQPDPLGREPGEPLEPLRFSMDAVKARIRALGSYLAAAMEQQRPSTAEGGILKRKWWKPYGPRPDELTYDDCLTSWDASFSDADGSSFVVGQCWARIGGQKFLLDQVRDRMDYPTFRTAVQTFAAKWPRARKHLIENKANGPAVIRDLYGKVPGLVPREPKGSKESRAHACAGEVEGGNVWIPDPSMNDIDPVVDRSFVHSFIGECALFPTGSHDDQVDAFTQALLEWQGADVPEQAHYRRTAGAGRR